jgi:hypothetical protein
MTEEERPDVGLAFKVDPGIADRLSMLQDAVRSQGHHRPSKRVLISALIHVASEDGEALEVGVLGPFRDDYPGESRDV